MKNLFLIGGGGHCYAAIDVIESTGSYEIKGIFDSNPDLKSVLGYRVLGQDKDIFQYISGDAEFLLTVGQLKSSDLRRRLFRELSEHGARWATVVSRLAYVSPHSRIGCGTIVMHGAIVNAGAVVGENCILNSKCLVEHEAIIGSHCHIATGAIVNGQVQIGIGSFVGSQSIIKQNSVLSENSFVQAGEFFRGSK